MALSPAPLLWGAGLVAAAGALAGFIGLRRPAVVAIAVLAVAGVLVGQARLEVLGVAHPGQARTGFIEGTATLLERPRESPNGATAPLELSDGGRVMAREGEGAGWPEGVAPGAILRVAGLARIPRPSSTSDFDYGAFLRRQGIVSEVELTSVSATGKRRGGLDGVIDSIRKRAEKAIDAGLSSPDAALLRGMVLGQDQAIATTTRDDFRRAGLAHLIAVSGQNIMLLGLLALPLLTLAGARPGLRIAVLIGLIALYVPLAGAGPSLQRAGIMGVAGLVAVGVGRPASRWYALVLAAAVTLTLNPLVLGDPGWQLSFAAVAGIVVMGPRITAALGGLPRVPAEGLAITVAATVATLPLLAVHFQVVSIASLPANLLALPAVAPVMWAGMADIAIGQLAVLGTPFDTMAQALSIALGWLVAVPLEYLSGLAHWAGALPWSQAAVPVSGPFAALAGYALVAVAAAASVWAARRGGTWADELAGRWRIAGHRRQGLILVTAGAAAVLICSPMVQAPAPPDDLTVRFLDVGQGDATLIQDPEGAAVLFDGGRPEARVSHLLRSAGVTRLTLVVSTHQSADHHGGLTEVLRRYPVDLLLENGGGTTDPTYGEMLATARAHGVPVETAAAGQVLRTGRLAIRVLGPGPRPPGPAPEDPNPRGVVAIVSEGDFDLFLSADAESPVLLPLDLPDVDAMKVPHHGSADPGLPEVLARLTPEVAVIEVGADNTYGHPSPQTLSALEAAGVDVHRTDLDGTVSLVVGPGGHSISAAR